MEPNDSPDLERSGTTDDRDETDCGCSALLACWPHFRDGDRGLPAVTRATGGV